MFPVTDKPIHSGLEDAARRMPDHPALLSGEDVDQLRGTRRPQLTRSLASSAAAWRHEGHMRVALMSANRVEFVVAAYAISKLGAVIVLISPAWKAREVARRCRHHTARVRRRRWRGSCAARRASGRCGAGSGFLWSRHGATRLLDRRSRLGRVCRWMMRFWCSARGRWACRKRSVTRTVRWATPCGTGLRCST